jgi:conjugal transfer pilus assembly protein TraW
MMDLRNLYSKLGWRRAGTALCVLLSGVGVWCATSAGAGDVQKHRPGKSPREAAEAIRQQAQIARDQYLPQTPKNPVTRDGIFLFVSWSIPDADLKTLMKQAHLLGATVVFRGMVEESWRKTVERTKAVAVELGAETPATTIDPILFRTVGVTVVPALAIVRDKDALVVTGSSPLRHLLTAMVREDASVRPLRDWLEQRERGWSQGGATIEPRPPLPVVKGVRAIGTDLARYDIVERDLEQVMRERIAQVDWTKARQEFGGRVKRKLEDGPKIALPTATEARQFTVDMTVTYDHDVTEPTSGTVLVKAGTRINPALSATYQQALVVINATDARQVAFAKRYVEERGRHRVKVLVTAGDVGKVSETVRDRAYWVSPEMVTRFQLAHVPSVISQRGPMMLVEEFKP